MNQNGIALSTIDTEILRSACPLTSTLSQLQPVLGQTKPKRSIFGVLSQSSQSAAFPRLFAERGETDQCHAILLAQIPRYGISHSSGIRTCTGLGNPPNRGVRLNKTGIGLGAQRGQRGATGPALSEPLVGMSNTSCFTPRVVAAMSWLARSMLCTKGLRRILSKMGTGMRPSPAHHRPYADTERHGHEPGRIAHLHAHENGVLALGLGLCERVAHVPNVGDRFAADVEDDVTASATSAQRPAHPVRHS